MCGYRVSVLLGGHWFGCTVIRRGENPQFTLHLGVLSYRVLVLISSQTYLEQHGQQAGSAVLWTEAALLEGGWPQPGPTPKDWLSLAVPRWGAGNVTVQMEELWSFALIYSRGVQVKDEYHITVASGKPWRANSLEELPLWRSTAPRECFGRPDCAGMPGENSFRTWLGGPRLRPSGVVRQTYRARLPSLSALWDERSEVSLWRGSGRALGGCKTWSFGSVPHGAVQQCAVDCWVCWGQQMQRSNWGTRNLWTPTH